MGGKDWKIIAGILGMAVLFFLLSVFLTEHPGQVLTGEQDHVSVPDKEVEDSSGEPKIFYHYEGPEPSTPEPGDRDTFGSEGESADRKEDFFILAKGEKLDLGDGYTLEIKQLDSEGKKVWLEIDRRGEFIEDQVITVPGSWEVKPERESGRKVEIYAAEVLESELILEVRQNP